MSKAHTVKELDKQVEITQKDHNKFNISNNLLKEMFFDVYDKETVNSVCRNAKEGHPIDKKSAEEFLKAYESGNFDDTMVVIFKNLFRRYYDGVSNDLGSKMEGQL